MSSADRTAGTDPSSPLEQLLDRVGERLPDRAEVARAFESSYTRRLAADEAAALSVDDLLGRIIGAFELADRRGAAEVVVRAFNPTMDEDRYEAAGSVVQTNSEGLSLPPRLRQRGARRPRALDHPCGPPGLRHAPRRSWETCGWRSGTSAR